ncbi:nuclear transport factor 2 family protein, partial [Rhizorhabdus sp.]
MLRRALGDRIDRDANSFVEMMAENGVMEFPYAPIGLPARLDGRAAIARHLENVGGMIAFDRMGEPTIHPSTDPDVVIIEFAGFGRGVTTGEPYDQSYIS